MGGELWCGLAQNGVNLDFQVKFDLEGQCRSVHKTIGTLTKVFCIFGPNLVTLAWTGRTSKWLTHTDRQTYTHTHTHTHTQPQATTIPEGQNWPGVKKSKHYIHILDKRVPVFHEDWFQLSVPPRCWEIIENENGTSPLFPQYTETEMSSFWWNFHHWLHWKLSKWQLPVQPVIKISSKWRHFRFSVIQQLRHQ